MVIRVTVATLAALLAGGIAFTGPTHAATADPVRQDPRLRYTQLVTAEAEAPVLDEDASVVTRYVRTSYLKRVRDALTSPDIEATAATLIETLHVHKLAQELFKTTLRRLNEASFDAGLPDKGDAAVEAASQRVTDVLLSYVDFDALEVDPKNVRLDGQGEVELAVPALQDVLRRLREGAAAKMRTDAAYFEQQAYIQGASKPTVIKRPSDFADFFVDEILLAEADQGDLADQLFADMGLAPEQARRAHTMAVGLAMAIGQTLVTNSEAQAAMELAIREAAR